MIGHLFSVLADLNFCNCYIFYYKFYSFFAGGYMNGEAPPTVNTVLSINSLLVTSPISTKSWTTSEQCYQILFPNINVKN